MSACMLEIEAEVEQIASDPPSPNRVSHFQMEASVTVDDPPPCRRPPSLSHSVRRSEFRVRPLAAGRSVSR